MSDTQTKNSLWRLATCGIIGLLLFYSLYFSIWTIFFTETGNGDNVEHIHATWLVAQGKIPYKDFFQHHNPLMWYLFAPLIKMFGNIMQILDVFHGVGVLFGIATFYTVYKISTRFFASSQATLIGLLILCPPYFYIYCFNYNPDTFMAFTFAIGLYYLFAYFEQSKLKSLILSFIFFFTAFLFTQKILIVLGILGIISMFVFYRKKTPLNNILYAIQLPLTGLVLFLSYLYYHDILGIYFKSNYLFNIRMQDYYGFNQINVIDYQVLIASTFLSVISIICFFRNSNTYFKIISLLFIWEFIQRVFYFSIAPYYMLPLMIYNVCLASKLIDSLNQKKEWLVYPFLVLAIFYAGISERRYLSARTQDRSFVRYLMSHVTPCDYVISSFLGNQSIISKDVHYYWSLLGHIDIAGEEIGIAPRPNLNALVKQYKPKLINDNMYWNSYYWNRNKRVPVQKISSEIIDKYYLPTPFAGFYLLKYEYQEKNCHYDAFRKDWIYAD